MTALRLILRSLLYHWRTNLAVACGVAAGTAVLTGALLVGDSMRGSLRELALNQLGRVNEALVGDRFFRAQLADELAANPDFEQRGESTVPVILLRGSLEKSGSDPAIRANQVNIIGGDERFWQSGDGGPTRPPGLGEIVLNQPLAEYLGVSAGDEVSVRLPRRGAIPADSALGQKDEQKNLTVAQLRLAEVIRADGLGRFGLRPTQRLPRNAYVALSWLQRQIKQPERVNCILTVGQALPDDDAANVRQSLTYDWHPRLEDYGIHIQTAPRGYLNITTDRMVFPEAEERAILAALKEPLAEREEYIQPAFTYLANTIACGTREMPYSTITAIDFAAEPPLGPFQTEGGKPIPSLADGEIAISSWAADDLQAKLGDTIRVTYFEPESTHGKPRETTQELRLAAVVKLAGVADDPDLAPTVPGLTDRTSLRRWDPPFPFAQERVRPKDEQYWRDHRATPKAFVSLTAGRRLWGSRFGQTTSIRVRPIPGMTAETLVRKLEHNLDPAAMGFVFQPVRQQALAAAAGTTPFNLLFLGFSSFIIAAAVMLVALLFRLGIERRAAEAGILLAIGFRRCQVVRIFAVEGLLVAALGSLLGMAGGIGYAALMLTGLRTWWLAAVSTPLLRLHIMPTSLLIGYASGLIVAFAAIAWSARRLGRIAPRRLLAGESSTGILPVSARSGTGKMPVLLQSAWLLTFVVSLVVAFAAHIPGEMEAGVFFGSGVLVLGLTLAVVWQRLRRGATGPAVAVGHGNLFRMALRNAARSPGRSALSIGLVASASFLIVAISAFRLDPAQQTPALDSGNGGFALVAESDQPIYRDLNTPEGRAELGFSPADEALLAQCKIYSLRVKPGDDASCLNLYQPRQPRLLGVPQSLLDRGGFAWAATQSGERNPWSVLCPLSLRERARVRALSPDDESTDSIPAVIDAATATYSLHVGLGQTFETTDARGRTLRLEVAGLLSNSIFQGDVLVSEEALLRYDSDVSGYRFFLIEAPPDQTAGVQAALDRTLGDYGFATETTAERLAGFLAVQNTYLSTFQSLGGLGLLLGTIGLAAVQMRNVLERRGELALLRAAGFRRALVTRLIMLENFLVLLLGLGTGLLAALVATLPHLLGRGASIPWLALAGILGLVLLVGIVAGMAAVRSLSAGSLTTALREDR